MVDELPLTGRDAEVHDAAAALQRPGSLAIIVGPVGGGRSRLARAVAAALARSGIHATVLDDVHDGDGAALAAGLAEVAAGGRLVATASALAPLPAPLLERVKAGACHRIELAPLTRPGVEALVAAAIGAPVDQRSVAELSRTSGGLPLYLLAIVDDARADGSLAVVAGLAQWSPERFVPARLADLVHGRLAGCDAEVRRTVELVATAEGLPLPVLHALEGRSAAVRAEAAGLLVGQRDAGRLVVALSVPAVGLAVAARVPLLRRLSYLERVLDAWSPDVPTGPGDRIRLATWALELGRGVEPDALVAAAEEALRRYRYGAAERLARAAGDAEHPGAATLVAVALEKQGRHAEALEALPADGPDASGRLVRAANLYWGRAALDEAESVLVEALPEATESPEVGATRAWLLMADGRQAEAATVADQVREVAPPEDPSHTWATVVSALGLALAGEGPQAVALTGSLDSFDAPGAPFERSAAGLARTFALLASGQVDDAVALTEEGLAWAMDEQVDLLIGAWNGLSGMAHRAAGDLEVACGHLRQAVWSLGDQDPYRFSRLFEAEAAAAWAQRGQAAEARAWWDQAGERDPDGLNRLFEPWIGRLGAWVLAAEGDLPAAADRALAAADTSVPLGQPFCEMAALHVVARLGRAGTVVNRAQALAERVATPPLQRMAHAIAATAAQDGQALRGAATTSASLGAHLLAAEAATAAVHAHRHRQQEAAARGALELRAQHLGRCGGAATPGTVAAGHATLTSRERDVALLAAKGVASAEIAARLGCSRRTVDNHLGRIYNKLGVHHRAELGALLGADGSSTPG